MVIDTIEENVIHNTMNEQTFLDDIFDESIDKVLNAIKNNKDLDINIIDQKLNISPLICAIDTLSPEIVELLLNNGANPNLMGSGMSLPLYHAVELAEEAEDYQSPNVPKILEIIKLLLAAGADPHLNNYNETSAYEYAEIRYLPAKKIFDSYL